MTGSRKSSRSFSARTKKDLRPHPPTAGSHGREASLPKAVPNWFGPQPTGKRKVARPFVANRPFEARLSAVQACGNWRLDLPGNRSAIRRILAREALRSGVRVYKVVIGSTSLQLELTAPRRTNLTLFFRAVAGRIPRAVTGTERGRPLRDGFWDGLVATRPLKGSH
jgi:hypothetical protein